MVNTTTTEEEPNSSSVKTTIVRDEAYGFTAPKWSDFLHEETKEEKQRSERWFESSGLSYAPSPSIPRIKARRSFKVENMRNFDEEEEEKPLKAEESSEQVVATEIDSNLTKKEEECTSKASNNNEDIQEHGSILEDDDNKENIPPSQTETCTHKPPMANTKRHHQNRSALMPLKPTQLSQTKGTNQTIIKRETNVKNIAPTHNLLQENQAIKRQKLDGGKSRQILNPKPAILPHKTKQGLVNTSFNLCPSITQKTRTENRKVHVRGKMNPFVSTAELMKKCQTSTRDFSMPHASTSQSQNQPTPMTLTRPKESEFMTTQRVRPVRFKSTAETEEEMLANMPKFKARPLNKKILAAPTLPTPQRRTPHPPEFRKFHLETMVRASQHAETSSVFSTEMPKHNDWRPHLTEPKSPLLHTTLRARPNKIKTSTEIEQEELEKVPKFKARPLNKKILESKGEMGIFSTAKKQVTIPQEFHFLTDERTPRPKSVIDLFDKLSLNSESCREKPLQRNNTTPNPFLLRTEECGAEKVKKFVTEVVHKQIEDKRVRIPKANPYPYTTDYPVVPPKPEPKQCTKPKPFQLESLARHEEELRKETEERMRMEREEVQRRVFRAQPVIKEDPIPVPEKIRKPLTEIQEFNLHVDHRAVERADFEHKIKEKAMMYKRYREETEAAKMVEEERALKQLRRTMVPHARPVPNFNNPFLPQKSNKETTKPKEPKLRVIKRIEKRKLIASSTHMR